MNNRGKLEKSGIKVGGIYRAREYGTGSVIVVRVEAIYLLTDNLKRGSLPESVQIVKERKGRGSLHIEVVDVETGKKHLYWSPNKFLGPVSS